MENSTDIIYFFNDGFPITAMPKSKDSNEEDLKIRIRKMILKF